MDVVCDLCDGPGWELECGLCLCPSCAACSASEEFEVYLLTSDGLVERGDDFTRWLEIAELGSGFTHTRPQG